MIDFVLNNLRHESFKVILVNLSALILPAQTNFGISGNGSIELRPADAAFPSFSLAPISFNNLRIDYGQPLPDELGPGRGRLSINDTNGQAFAHLRRCHAYAILSAFQRKIHIVNTVLDLSRPYLLIIQSPGRNP